MKRVLLIALLGSGLVSGGGATGVARAAEGKLPGQAGTGIDDPQFQLLLKIHEANSAEIQLGELARSRAADPQVKLFAEKLIADHNAADKTVTDRAINRGWSFAGQHTDSWIKDQANLEEEKAMLRIKGGEAFDREFLTHMVAGHEKLMPVLADKLDTISDPAFHEEIKGIYDKVVSHRDQARRLLKDLDERKNTRGEERKP